MFGCPAAADGWQAGWQAGRRKSGAAARCCGSTVHIECSRDENLNGIPNER